LGVVEQLLNHINRHALCKTTDKILLAVSGGLDSMVMLHLMKEAGFDVGVAHCNFQLRGEASIADEEFVRRHAGDLRVPFHSEKFDTAGYAITQGISIQMAARDLRYDFFRKVLRQHGYAHIATAHHFNDVIESVIMNLVRGTGIDGVSGIAPAKQNIIRPLLFATRQMIMEFAAARAIGWREDSSNATDDYQRNFIRHQVIPLFQQINPSFEGTFRDTHERLVGASQFSSAYIASFESTARKVQGDKITIDMRKLHQLESPAVMLWELTKELGFKFDQCRKAVNASQPGKMVFSATHQLLADRTQFVIEPKRSSEFPGTVIERGQSTGGMPPHVLTFQEVVRADFKLRKDPAVAQLNADQLKYPLFLRTWRAGDYFVPLGMRQEKKVSDFLIDLKIPFNSKADVTVLESAGDIVWIVGYRISERYKVTPDAERILVIEQRSVRQ
jgi:tRNA(Ile)-lysidine synthase